MGTTLPQINVYIPSLASERYKIYHNGELGFSLEYPSNWAVSESVDQNVVADIKPIGYGGHGSVKIYLQKNSYKDIYALKSAVDKRVGGSADSSVLHNQNFDALLYAKLSGSAVMYVPLNKDIVLGITGPDNASTVRIFNSFAKL